MCHQFILRILSAALFSVCLINPSLAMDSSDENISGDEGYSPRSSTPDTKAEDFLDSFDGLKLTEKDYCDKTEGYFFSILQDYKSGLFEERKEEIANKLRGYELALSEYYDGNKFKPKNLWDSQDELEFFCVDSIEKLQEAINRGATKSPQDIYELILNGGKTSTNFHSQLPPKFFRLPSNFKGNKFLIGGERANPNDQQDTYILNFDRSKKPDILGDAQDHSCYVCIPTHKFSLIEFDFIDNRILNNENVLLECVRIMEPTGVFVFKTCHNTIKFYQEIKSELKNALKVLKLLYTNVKVENKQDDNWPTKAEKFYYYFEAKNPKK